MIKRPDIPEVGVETVYECQGRGGQRVYVHIVTHCPFCGGIHRHPAHGPRVRDAACMRGRYRLKVE